MPEEVIRKAGALGSAITSWGKILFVTAAIIGGAFMTYYQIQHNAIKNDSQDVEHQLMNERSDKRYKRAMGTADELKKKDKEHDKMDLEIIKEIYYIKGRLDQMEKNN